MKRRTFLFHLASPWAAAVAMAQTAAAARPAFKAIPSLSGEQLPLVGLGSWITFNVGDDPRRGAPAPTSCAAFAERGGRLIDSSPMYGSSQGVIGEGLARWPGPARLFAADKVWIAGARGPAQIEASRRLWRCRASTCCRCTTCWPGRTTCRSCWR